MPDPNNNAKASGDIHPPEVESELPLQNGNGNPLGADGTPSDRGRRTESGMEGKPGRGINQAGLLKEKDDEASDGSSTGDAEQGSRPGRG